MEEKEKKTPQFPISMAMIVRNCEQAAKNTLDSLVPFLTHPDDEVVIVDTGSTDQTADNLAVVQYPFKIVVHRHPELTDPEMPARMARLKPGHWERFRDLPQFQGGCLSDFAAARQLSLDYAKNEIYGWIDSDDTLEGEGARALVDDFFSDPGRDCLFFRYDYSHDPQDFVCTTALMRERFIRKSKYYWVGKCHETLLPKSGAMTPMVCGNPTVYVRHVPEHRKAHGFSDIRNYAIMYPEIEAAKGDLDAVDPRTLYYLGNAARGLDEKLEAIKWYVEFLPRSGSRDDRLLAVLHVGALFQSVGRQWKALRFFQEAELLHPEDPRPQIGMAQAYCELGRWPQAIEAAERGLAKVPGYQTLSSYDPTSLTFFPYLFIATAAKEMGDAQRALWATNQALQARPQNEGAQHFRQFIQAWATRYGLAAAIQNTVNQAVSVPAKVEILQKLNFPNLEEFGVAKPEADINRRGRSTVTLFCGGTAEPWGPKGPEGIGGSERMVIEMTRRLQARNLAVTVYCNLPPDQKGTHDNVVWRHFLEFNPTIARDFLVVWRAVQGLQMGVPAKRRYVWLHDITPDAVWDPTNVLLCDKALFLSPWHRSLCPSLPDTKAYVTRNGIDVPAIEAREKKNIEEGLARDPNLAVYASSPDRGLANALVSWKHLENEGQLPAGARLVVLYGFNATYLKLASLPHGEYGCIDGVMRHRLDYQEGICALLDQMPSVEMRGRVSTEEVHKLFLQAGAWFYPTLFDETFCIVAAEAQACGCVPVCSNRAGLQTTVRHGIKFDDINQAPEALANYFKAPKDFDRATMAVEARQAYALDDLANQWYLDLFGDL